MKRLQILGTAIDDLRYGKEFYEHQQEGLGEYFLDSLFSDIDALMLYAGLHEQHLGYYRILSKRFPFAIYYTLNSDDIQVWRVLDCRQNPARTQKSLKFPD